MNLKIVLEKGEPFGTVEIPDELIAKITPAPGAQLHDVEAHLKEAEERAVSAETELAAVKDSVAALTFEQWWEIGEKLGHIDAATLQEEAPAEESGTSSEQKPQRLSHVIAKRIHRKE